MVAYYFPPGGGIGVQRSLKFVKYLPDMGWIPSILSTETPQGIPHDEILLNEIPKQAQVYRVNPLFNTTKCSSPNRNFLARFFGACLIPDAIVPWIQPAFKMGCKIIKNRGIDVIYSTSPPHSSHIVGYLLKRRTKLPWVADFRDAWLADPDKNRSLITRMRLGTVEKLQERLVIKNADRIITVTEPIRQDFIIRYQLSDEKAILIANGYDPDDFIKIKRRRHSKFTFTYTGSMTKQNRSPKPFLEGIRLLLDKYPQLAESLQVFLIGDHTPEQAAFVSRYSLSKIVHMVGNVPYRSALTYQINADVNVFIYTGPNDDRSKQMMSGKIFDYVGASRPILAIAPPNIVASRLVRELKLGRDVPPKSPEKIAETMYEMMENGNNTFSVPIERLKKYHRSELTRKLVNVFDRLSK